MSKEIKFLENELGIARKNFKTASDDYAAFGRYEDCGPSYAQSYTEAKAILDYLERLLQRIKN